MRSFVLALLLANAAALPAAAAASDGETASADSGLQTLANVVVSIHDPIALAAFGFLILYAIFVSAATVKEIARLFQQGELYNLLREIVRAGLWLSIVAIICITASHILVDARSASKAATSASEEAKKAAFEAHLAARPETLPPIPLPAIANPASLLAAVAQPRAKPEYKLVWVNHFDSPDPIWEVTHTDTSLAEVRNDQFKSWCIPFDENKYVVLQRELVAGDEVFKGPKAANWWAAAPYALPALNPRWLQIMDDEKWYVYEVLPKESSR